MAQELWQAAKIIQPKWPTDEYARIDRICVWFIPPNPPTKLDPLAKTHARRITEYKSATSISVPIRKRGATFCQVARIRQDSQGNPAITLGNQKWKGNTPILVKRPARMAITAPEEKGSEGSQVKEMEQASKLPKIKRPDPRAWTIKYFTADSLSEVLFWYKRTGRNPIRLTSKPAHTPNQWEEERENIVPKTATNRNKKVNGSLENIRKRMGRTTQNKVSSPVLL